MKDKLLHLHTEFTFDSAHKLEDYDGKCKNIHGHSWKAEIEFKGKESQKNTIGILIDFSIVKELKEMLDHKYLNDVVKMNPTAENLSGFIYRFLHTYIKDELGLKDILIQVKLFESYIDKKAYCEIGDWE